MKELTVSQAASKMSLTQQRVLQLIESRALAARKVGHMWLVDQKSVSGWKRPRRGPKPKRRTA